MRADEMGTISCKKAEILQDSVGTGQNSRLWGSSRLLASSGDPMMNWGCEWTDGCSALSLYPDFTFL